MKVFTDSEHKEGQFLACKVPNLHYFLKCYFYQCTFYVSKLYIYIWSSGGCKH